MKGYWNRPEATAEVLRDGWLYTGDLGYFDSGGNLFITGRRKEVIVLANGKNVYPEEIEAHYLQAQYVKEICVMALEARPGDPTSERLHAVVVPNFELLRERKIVNSKEAIRSEIEALSHKIASTKRLGSYDIWQEDLPRTTTRKLKRFQIEKKVRELQQKQGGGDSERWRRKAPLTDDEQPWLEREDVKRALTIIRESSRESSRNRLDAIRPTHNLELDLGLDSMQRVELLTALEQQLGGDVPESQLAEIYSVRDLVDAVLASASRGEGQARAAAPAWSTILSEPVTDPEVLALARHNIFCRSLFLSAGTADLSFRARSLSPQNPRTRKSAGKRPVPDLLESPELYRSAGDGGGAAVAPVSRCFCARHERHFRHRDSCGGWRDGCAWSSSIPTRTWCPPCAPELLASARDAFWFSIPKASAPTMATRDVFRKGAAILSIHTQAPIVPVAIEGFYEAWPRHKNFPSSPICNWYSASRFNLRRCEKRARPLMNG